MMRINLAQLSMLLGGCLLCSGVFAQGGRGILAADPKNAGRTYDKHDISGIWSRNGSPGGMAAAVLAGIVETAVSITMSQP
jgi:hypothetical protein